MPKYVLFEPAALEYPLGRQIFDRMKGLGIEPKFTGSHNRVTGIPGDTPLEIYRNAKATLVVGVRKSADFAPCKPSAHYQLPLNTSCPSMCEYCYLQTTLGKRPYLRVYVNIEDILAKAAAAISARAPEITVFEGAATSDPIPTEHLTGILRMAIEFFGRQQYGRFRFVTKHIGVDSLLDARHQGHTRFRFSVNAAPVIFNYEHLTPPLAERLAAAGKVSRAGYPMGFIVAPIFHFTGWREQYARMFEEMDAVLAPGSRANLTFELITHRFTARAKGNIEGLFPETTLPMEKAGRKFKYGQFGYGKYVYEPESMAEMKDFFTKEISRRFSDAHVDYFI